MRGRSLFQWPPDKERERRKAIRLEWITLAGMGSVVLVVYFVLGNSQAMRTAWIEDMVGMVPAIIYLVAAHVERRDPSDGFPFGFYRSFSIAYLFGATATLFVGLYLLAESAGKLIAQEHPTIGLMSVFGYDVWAGWLMIAALVYSIIPPVILGRLKMPVAEAIHDKVLVADGSMQKADWLADVAAIAGIIGIAFGFWWADAVAAAIISVDIAYDGGRHVLRAIRDLLDQTPRTIDRAEPYPGIKAIRSAVLALGWVEQVKVEMREEGRLLTGTIYVTPREGVDAIDRLEEVSQAARASEWRLYEPVVALVPADQI
jgi:cation diffusion facilitator family transporter